MSELDFEARYTGDSEDEIGVLGHSMNTLGLKSLRRPSVSWY
ncbi:MAG: hypothetical protein ACLR0U_09740 [Enterocloster clostridioformis]